MSWRKGMGAPFESQEVFGLSSSTFGSGMLVVAPTGEVLKQLYSLQGTAVYDVLLESLRESPGVFVPPPELGDTRQESIQHLIRSGQLQQAAALLGELPPGEDPVREAILNSELQRLQRNGKKALKPLTAALLLDDAEMQSRGNWRAPLLMKKAHLLTVTGSPEKAEESLASLITTDATVAPAIRAEALHLKGALRFQAKDAQGAESYWGRLLAEHGESRWAWGAAAILTGPAWKLKLYPNLQWPSAEHRRLISLPEQPLDLSRAMEAEEMIQSAANYLIASQQVSGCWVTLTAYSSPEDLDDEFDLAATAIGGRALLRMESRPDAQHSAQRALAWMHKRQAKLKQRKDLPIAFMDYAVWSRSYGIFFLADCLESGVGQEEQNGELLQEYLNDLYQRQQPNGGWSYYISGVAGGTSIPQSISFTTATVVMALERADELGFDVPPEALARGLDCLEAMRSPHQTFGYFLRGSDLATGQRTGDGVEASAARGPACALALLRGARADNAALATHMELYIKHLPGFGAQRRKALMHAGAHTQGSHYLLYDYSTAAEALHEMGGDGVLAHLRQRLEDSILRELRACRNADGSYLDNPLMGADVGTGLALSCLLDLAN
ncbi:MAG: hypothetical protein ACI9F9_002659 [Candidatus Paceibacteria bacterium]